MKIIIVGAGFSCVSTYLLLRKLISSFGMPCAVILYEAHDSREASGTSSPLLSKSGGEDLTDSAAVVGCSNTST